MRLYLPPKGFSKEISIILISFLFFLIPKGILAQGQATPPFSVKREASPAAETSSPTGSETYYYERKVEPSPIPEKGPSRIEEFFGGKLPLGKERLEQFGYDFFLPKGGEAPPVSNIPVHKDYILGPGDTLQIYTWGNAPSSFSEVTAVKKAGEYDYSQPMEIRVNRDGGIFLPRIGLIHVWGMKLGDLGSLLLDKLSYEMKEVEIGVALARPRTFPVYVVGEVMRPGSVIVNGVSTVIEALIATGGVEKNGSLRNVLLRKGSEEYPIDLYDFLIFGKKSPIFLSEGDVVLVSPIGPTVGVAGNVKRPGIYELKQSITISEAIRLGGGTLPSGSLERVQVERFSANEKKVALDIDLFRANEVSSPLEDGDLIKVFPVYDVPENVVSLEGNAKTPGTYQYKEGMKLSHLIPRSESLLPETYMEYAEIIRKEGLELHPITIPFKLSDLLNKKVDFPLRPLDRIKVFSSYAFPRVEVSGEVKRPGVYPFWPGMKLSDVLAQAGGITESPEKLKAELLTAEELEIELGVESTQETGTTPSERLPSLTRRSTEPTQETGTETVREKEKKETKMAKEFRTNRIIYLLDLLVKNRQEFNFSLKPGDKIIVKRIEERERQPSVYVWGEVKNPGTYSIKKGEKLSSVLKKAGGYTEDAYLTGAVFTREEVKETQRRLQQEAMAMLQKELLIEEVITAREEKQYETGLSLSRSEEGESRSTAVSPAFPPQTTVITGEQARSARQDVIKSLFEKEPIGRVVVRLEKDFNAFSKSKDDIALEDGDSIFIPKKPSQVLAMGEVYSPTSLLYQPSSTVKDYLSQVGGITKNGDKDSIFVLRADGSVISKDQLKGRKKAKIWSVEENKWVTAKNFEDVQLNPGDAVVVPMAFKKPKGFGRSARDMMQVLWQTTATIGVLGVLLF